MKYDNKNKDLQLVVLVVDDDMMERLLVREALERADIRVEEAENGAEALSVFRRVSPDLIFLDVRMPVVDGFSSCANLRKETGGEDVPIIMVTGLDDIESIERAYEVGATDFITKPINWPTLHHRVRYMIRASRAFQGLQKSEARLSQAQRIAHIGHWRHNLQTNVLYWSDEIYRIFGLEKSAGILSYEKFMKSVHPNDRPAMREVLNDAISENKSYNIDFRVVLPDGRGCVVQQQGEIVFDDAEKSPQMIGTIQDITQQKKDEEKILDLAYYDSLTGLPNRQNFLNYTSRTLSRAKQTGTKATLIYLDLDGFKHINDTAGHGAGDEALKIIADLLNNQLRNSDIVARIKTEKDEMVPLARLGGDEFTILLPNISKQESIAKVARRILDVISQPTMVEGREYYIPGSMGITIYPEDGQDVETLLKHSDMAMYAAKKKGGNCFQFYSESMNIQVLKRLNMETRLRKAIARDELALHYQPLMDIKTGKILGFEALARWENADLGLVSPSDFIPLAEEAGLILSIGEWALRNACAQTKVWQEETGVDLTVAVNVSALQFKQDYLVKTVAAVIKETTLNPRSLKLELTESILMENIEEIVKKLLQLKEIGVGHSIDDFGTGYSSLGYLKRFPIDSVKIDKSFVQDMLTDPDDAAIIRAIIALSHNLRLKVIAEGVETDEQLQYLMTHDCDTIQGYLIASPLPPEDVIPFLNCHRSKESH